MTLLLIDSFDHYTAMAYKYISPDSISGTITSGSGRNGTSAGKNITMLRYLSTPYPSTVTVGFAWYPTAYTASDYGFIDLEQDDNYGARVVVTSEHTLALYRGTWWVAESVNTYDLNTWYYLEFQSHTDNSTGLMTLKIDGVEWASYSGDTDANDVGYVSGIYITAGYPITSYIDDMYILDSSGSTNNDFLGDVTVRSYLPDADGNYTQWTPSSGSTHYSLVNSIPITGSNSVSASSGSVRDCYSLQDSTATGNILGVQSCSLTYSDGGNIKDLVRISGADYTSGSIPANAGGTRYRMVVYEQNPGTNAAWTNDAINGAEFGVELVT